MTLDDFVLARYGVRRIDPTEEPGPEQLQRVTGKTDRALLTERDLGRLRLDTFEQLRLHEARLAWLTWLVNSKKAGGPASGRAMLERLDREMQERGFPVVADAPVPLPEVKLPVRFEGSGEG